MAVNLKDIQKAQDAIKPYAKRTPLKKSEFLSTLTSANVYLKLENQQVTNSFKIRGVMNLMLHLTPEQKKQGVITASAGNHGQALAFGAQKMGFSAKVVVPANTPKVKVDGIKKFGVDLLLFGGSYAEAEKKAKELAKAEGRLYVSPYNHPYLVAGHGTAGLEILFELPDVDVVLVPVGGGGLIAGVSTAIKNLKPNIKVVGVQSEATPIMYESLKMGQIVPAHRHKPNTIAEGLAGSIEEGSITFTIAQKYVDEVVLVKEETISRAVYLLCENDQQKVEGSGAAGVALLLEKPELFKGLTVAVLVSGGNIDDSRLDGIYDAEEKTV
ncbi:MAG: threonine/serine dehydratase [Candidatus Bathyarchaeia archaeon]|jgi:threonine dehydratase